MGEILFDMLPFRIFHHLFYCNRGFYVCNKFVYCARFQVRDKYISSYLNDKFSYTKNYFPDFKDHFLLQKISLFIHYYGIIYSSRDKNFENNYGNFGVLYYEEVDRVFLLYKLYLEIFARVVFNNALKKLLPIFLREIDSKKFACRRKQSYCQNNLLCKGSFRKMVTFDFIKFTAVFVHHCIGFNNDSANIDAFTYIFDNYKKGIVYRSPH